MADKPLFSLDAEGRWRLAYDRQQWVIQRRAGTPCQRGSDSAAMRRTGWRAVSFIGGKKATLRRVLGEKGVVLTAEAQARLDALPDQFLVFLGEIDSPPPDKARSCATRPSGGPEYPRDGEGTSTRVFTACSSEPA